MGFKEIEEGRAKFAFECAKNGSKLGKKKEYKSYVKNIPMYIKLNGLAPTFAFVFSKTKKDDSGDPYTLIYKQTRDWLKKEPRGLIGGRLGDNNKELSQVFTELDSATYRAITLEVLSFFNWLRRFADGLIEDPEGDKNEKE